MGGEERGLELIRLPIAPLSLSDEMIRFFADEIVWLDNRWTSCMVYQQAQRTNDI